MLEFLFSKPVSSKTLKESGYMGYEVTELKKTYRPKPTYFASRPAKRWKNEMYKLYLL